MPPLRVISGDVLAYVVLMFAADEQVCFADVIVTATKAAAQVKATELYRSIPEAAGFELWLEGDKAFSWFPPVAARAQTG